MSTSEKSDFASLNLPEAQLFNLDRLGYTQMTPVQAQCLPVVLIGRDLIAQAKTGSGKTAVFGLGLVETIDPHASSTQALILCPTRIRASR